MNLGQLIHQILIEENPYTQMPDVQSRFIYYEECSVNIEFSLRDMLHSGDKPSHDCLIDTIKEQVHREFGSDVNTKSLNNVCMRICAAVLSEQSSESFLNV
jgi:hypothetical protein